MNPTMPGIDNDSYVKGTLLFFYKESIAVSRVHPKLSLAGGYTSQGGQSATADASTGQS